ncbi:MAG: FAD:protein FMN transferase [Pseudomonadota bacterium]
MRPDKIAGRRHCGWPGVVAALVACLGLLALATLFRPGNVAVEFRETRYVFGTLVEIVIRDTDAQMAREAAAEVGALLQSLHHDWHAWQQGRLTDLNAAIAARRPSRMDPRLATVLTEGQRLACLSGGLFQPAIGRLVALWGFHADTLPEGGPPSASAVAALRRANPRMADLRLDGDILRSTNPAVQLDLGGFAKGAALDLANEALRARGIENAVLNAGGDVNVLGTHGARPWRVAVRDPFVWGAIASVALRPGEVLYTSGNYERFFEHEGARFAHIVDPRTGVPVREIVSVSVLDTNGLRADAAATALSVAGRSGFAATAAAMGVEAVLMIADDGEVIATPAMRARLEPAGESFPDAITIQPLPDVTPPDCEQPR